MRRRLALLAVLWLAIGIFASWQRGYLSRSSLQTCRTAQYYVLTVAAGPLNYLGVDTTRGQCLVGGLPQPGQVVRQGATRR